MRRSLAARRSPLARAALTTSLPTPQAVQRNASLYIHALLAPSGTPLDPSSPTYDATAVHARTWRANAHLPRPKNKTGVKLLEAKKEEKGQGGGAGGDVDATPGRILAGFGGGGEVGGAGADAAKAAAAPREIISYLKPNLTIALIDEFSAFPANAVPPHVSNGEWVWERAGGEGQARGREWTPTPTTTTPSHLIPSLFSSSLFSPLPLL